MVPSPRSQPQNPVQGVRRPRRTFGGVIGGLIGLLALSTVAGTLVALPLVPVVAVGSQAAAGTVSLFDNMPSDLEIAPLMLPTTIYARDPATGQDVELTSFYDQNRVPVEFEQISPMMYDAVLSAEDPRYFRHGGVDLIGTTRAFLSNAQGNAIQGGSSISQQYVKNVLIQRCERDAVATETQSRDAALQACWEEATDATGMEGYERKLQEIRYAVQLEREYAKNEILVGYLNIANFGGTTYGVEAAARFYFGATAATLSLGQAATLAGIVQNPNTYRIDRAEGSIFGNDGTRYNRAADGSIDDVNPGTLAGLDTLLAQGRITPEQHLAAGDAYSATKGRQLYVLDRMREEGRITDEQYVAAAIEPIAPQLDPVETGCATSGAPFFCQYVVNTVRRDPAYAAAFGETADDRQRALTREGLRIYTTLDWRMQNAAQDTVRRYAPAVVGGMDFGASAVNVEAATGRILSIAQNDNFSEDADVIATDPAFTSLVYAGDMVHGVSTGFLTGSTFKLFTLVDWLEQGHSLYEPVNGTVRAIPRLENSCRGPWVNMEDFVVNNFGNAPGGIATPMDFTAQSLNTGYLGMAEQLDVCDIENVVERMGVTRGNGERVQLEGASSIIGTSGDIAPVTMASAYATVANNGVQCTPYVIERVVDAAGTERPLPDRACRQAISPEVAAAAAFALQGVMQPGGTGSGGNPNDGTPLIGKTGTNQEFQTWLVESSTTVATAVWVGNVIGQADIFRINHNGLALSQVRTPIAREIQGVANSLYPAGAFPAPAPQFLTRPAPPAPTPAPGDGTNPGPGGESDGGDATGGDQGPDGGGQGQNGGGPGQNGGGNGQGRGGGQD